MAFVGKVKMNPGHPFAHTQISFGGNVRQARTTRQRASGTGTVYLQVLDLDDLDHIRLLSESVLPHLT